MSRSLLIAALGGLLLAALPAAAQEPIVYPAKGQSPDQVEQDKYQCYQWAKGETGFDPMAPPTATAPPPPNQAPTASTGRSAVGGAVTGSLIGGIADGDWGKGAAIGAAAGAGAGALKDSDREKKAKQGAKVYQAEFKHCMSGKGF